MPLARSSLERRRSTRILRSEGICSAPQWGGSWPHQRKQGKRRRTRMSVPPDRSGIKFIRGGGRGARSHRSPWLQMSNKSLESRASFCVCASRARLGEHSHVLRQHRSTRGTRTWDTTSFEPCQISDRDICNLRELDLGVLESRRQPFTCRPWRRGKWPAGVRGTAGWSGAGRPRNRQRAR